MTGSRLYPSQIRDALQARRLPHYRKARLIRISAGATQQDVADACGVHRVTVARWEAGLRKPRGSVASRYGKVLRELQELDW